MTKLISMTLLFVSLSIICVRTPNHTIRALLATLLFSAAIFALGALVVFSKEKDDAASLRRRYLRKLHRLADLAASSYSRRLHRLVDNMNLVTPETLEEFERFLADAAHDDEGCGEAVNAEPEVRVPRT